MLASVAILRSARSGGTGDPELETVLDAVRAAGLELAGFTTSFLAHGVRRRMRELGGPTFAEYLALLASEAGEAAALCHSLFLNVTAFFRDRPHWDLLAREVLPSLRSLAGAGPVRAWSAGCSTGEEAYSVAMVLEGVPFSVLATDVDADALARAAEAFYGEREAAAVPPRLRRRHLRREGTGWRVSPGLREAVEVRRHDLSADPFPAGLHLVVCRHTLMYLEPRARTRAVLGFHGALVEGGFLFVEATDGLGGPDGLFAPLRAGHPILVREP